MAAARRCAPSWLPRAFGLLHSIPRARGLTLPVLTCWAPPTATRSRPPARALPALNPLNDGGRQPGQAARSWEALERSKSAWEPGGGTLAARPYQAAAAALPLFMTVR